MAAKILIIYVPLFGVVNSNTCGPFQIGKNNLDKALVGHMVLEINGTSHHECARYCMSFGICKSFDYDRNERSCKLNDVDMSSVDQSEFITKRGSIFSDISEWPVEMAGGCGTRPCPENQICFVNGESYMCKDTNCADYKQLDHGYMHVLAPNKNGLRDKAMVKCDVGYIPSIQEVECQYSGQWQPAVCQKLSDCREILDKFPHAKSGLYDIQLWTSGQIMTVNCDMETEGGGWTVFHRRLDGSVDFYRNFKEYEEGFGHADGEFWLGLKNIRELAEQGSTDLRLDMTNENDDSAQETFQEFMLGDGPSYTLAIGTRYENNITLRDGFQYNARAPFSTYDRDVDTNENLHCAVDRHGGWWHKRCTRANLNGLYVTPGTFCDYPGAQYGVCGNVHKGFNSERSLKKSSMMLRRV